MVVVGVSLVESVEDSVVVVKGPTVVGVSVSVVAGSVVGVIGDSVVVVVVVWSSGS